MYRHVETYETMYTSYFKKCMPKCLWIAGNMLTLFIKSSKISKNDKNWNVIFSNGINFGFSDFFKAANPLQCSYLNNHLWDTCLVEHAQTIDLKLHILPFTDTFDRTTSDQRLCVRLLYMLYELVWWYVVV